MSHVITVGNVVCALIAFGLLRGLDRAITRACARYRARLVREGRERAAAIAAAFDAVYGEPKP
jgi:hypothetical protein